MNKTQITYKNAKAALDKANKIAAAELAKYEYLLDEETQEACAQYSQMCVKVETDLGIVALIEALRKAEDEMIDWMIETVSKSKEYSAKYANMTADIKAHLHLLKIRKMVVELAYKLG